MNAYQKAYRLKLKNKSRRKTTKAGRNKRNGSKSKTKVKKQLTAVKERRKEQRYVLERSMTIKGLWRSILCTFKNFEAKNLKKCYQRPDVKASPKSIF